jgi:hypothetical protein
VLLLFSFQAFFILLLHLLSGLAFLFQFLFQLLLLPLALFSFLFLLLLDLLLFLLALLAFLFLLVLLCHLRFVHLFTLLEGDVHGYFHLFYTSRSMFLENNFSVLPLITNLSRQWNDDIISPLILG